MFLMIQHLQFLETVSLEEGQLQPVGDNLESGSSRQDHTNV